MVSTDSSDFCKDFCILDIKPSDKESDLTATQSIQLISNILEYFELTAPLYVLIQVDILAVAVEAIQTVDDYNLEV